MNCMVIFGTPAPVILLICICVIQEEHKLCIKKFLGYQFCSSILLLCSLEKIFLSWPVFYMGIVLKVCCPVTWGFWHHNLSSYLVQRFSGTFLQLSSSITIFTVKTCFSHILYLCSTETIVQNFSPALYIVLHYTLDIGFFWTVFLAIFLPQHLLFKSTGNKCCLFVGIHFSHLCTPIVAHKTWLNSRLMFQHC